MNRELMAILACPVCKEGLDLGVEEEDPQSGEVLRGSLKCTTCGRTYDIQDGIPDLRPPAED
jgi:uncharacterized protein YbaR (Trm112 family)